MVWHSEKYPIVFLFFHPTPPPSPPPCPLVMSISKHSALRNNTEPHFLYTPPSTKFFSRSLWPQNIPFLPNFESLSNGMSPTNGSFCPGWGTRRSVSQWSPFPPSVSVSCTWWSPRIAQAVGTNAWRLSFLIWATVHGVPVNSACTLKILRSS